MSEILVIIAIALAIFMLPRLTGKQDKKESTGSRAGLQMNGWLRLAVMASVLWPAGTAFLLKPWNTQWPMFFYAGIGPVVLFWGLFWVLSGFRKGGKSP